MKINNNELVMPKNYSVVNAEEMTYVDGGGWYQAGVYCAVELGANILFNAALGGGTLSCARAVFKKLGTEEFKKTLTNVLKKWVSVRVANTIAGSIAGFITDLGSFSVGGFVAEIFDRLDGDNDNEIYFSRIF